jgi:hypothetical protein
VHLPLGRSKPEQVIYLDEDVYVALGDPASPSSRPTAWPPCGSYGPVPEHGVVGHLTEVLGGLAPELWSAKRRGAEVCLTAQLTTYDPATVLRWGADCVEHLARRVNGVDGNVVESLGLARAYARDRAFDSVNSRRLADEAQSILERLRKEGTASFGRAIVSRALELESGVGLLGPSETRYEANEHAIADLRAMQVALMHATKALCGADPLVSGREAARWSRRASARNALAQEAGDRANGANEASWFNLLLNPFAQGTLARSLPGQVKAIQDGDIPETEWQAARLREHLDETPGDPPAPVY